MELLYLRNARISIKKEVKKKMYTLFTYTKMFSWDWIKHWTLPQILSDLIY